MTPQGTELDQVLKYTWLTRKHRTGENDQRGLAQENGQRVELIIIK